MKEERFEKGVGVRRAVLGKGYADNSINNATDFNRDLQKLVTDYCWGKVWTRPDLPRIPKYYKPRNEDCYK